MGQVNEQSNIKIIWQNLKAGDKSSFNLLFRKYYSELYYYGLKIFPDSEIIKDCIQEVFVRIWETRESLGNVDNVKSYLIVSVRRMILTQNEKNANKRKVEDGFSENDSFSFDINEFEKHEELSDEIRQILLNSINSLTKKQRELIMLFFYHELSYSEIADVFGISVESLRNLMYRTLKHLRESIGSNSLDSLKNMFFLLFSSFSLKKM
jgi:RNA polymerase sigma-70 factor (ECF subfamily)